MLYFAAAAPAAALLTTAKRIWSATVSNNTVVGIDSLRTDVGERLLRLRNLVHELPSTPVRVEGFTDATSTEVYSNSPSGQAARVVRMVKTFGVSKLESVVFK